MTTKRRFVAAVAVGLAGLSQALLGAASPSPAGAQSDGASPSGAASPSAHIEAGDVAMRGFDPAKAAAEYEQALHLSPDSYEALVKATHALRDAGEALKIQGSKEAEGYFERANARAKALLQRYPDRAEAHYYVASTSGQLALFRGAREKVRLSREIEKEAKAAIALDPADGRPHAVLGVYYREVANANGFTKMLARTLLGGLPDGTNEDAVRELTKAVELNPNDLYATFELARTYQILEEPEEEKAALRTVLALPERNQRDPRLKEQAAERLRALGQR